MFRLQLFSLPTWSSFRAASVALVVCAAIARSEAAVELSAVHEEYAGEGVMYQRLVLKDDQRRLELELPGGWRHRGEGPARLILLPPGSGFAEGVLELQPLSPGAAATEDSLRAALEQQALTVVPEDSQAVALIERKPQWAAALQAYAPLEAVVTYKTRGYTFLRSTVILNLRESRLVLRFTAPEAEFEKLNTAFLRAVASCDWQ